MMRLALASLANFLVLSLPAGTGDVIRTARELATATFDCEEFGRPFDVTVWLTTPCSTNNEATFSAEDESGAMIFRKEYVGWPPSSITAGHRVRLRGHIACGKRSKRAYARCDSLAMLGKRPSADPTPITAAQFASGEFDCRLISIDGIIHGIIADEIGRNTSYLLLSAGNDCIYMPIPSHCPNRAQLKPGAKVRVVGIVTPSFPTARRHLGRYINATHIDIIVPGTTDPFAVPELADHVRIRPQEIAALGRRRVSGRVIAVWHGDSALVKTHRGQIVRLEIAEGGVPRYGETIEAVGAPESDLYHLNLSRTIWRHVDRPAIPDECPRDLKAEDLRTDFDGRPCFDPFAHGQAIRLHGIIRNLPGEGNDDGRFNIESGAFIVPIDVSATPNALRDLSVGCEVSVAGTCVMESDNWRPNVPFPTIRGFTVVIRMPADIVVLKRPSWWTPARLAMVLGALFVVLLGSLVGNALLKRVAERRGAELAKTAIAKAESDLRVYERTRLAVELHDSISQYLTGISLAIRAATKFATGSAEGLRLNLALATTSLDSCRQELRNCLWDLRNQTLDEKDINIAIRQTLEPHLGDCELSVRFNVPRDRFSDKSAHAILHILRELATNAVRHGKASHVWVAGSVENDKLLFSVRDNGCGFEPDACPGMDQGHFGLQGIRERVNQFEGQISIESKPGSGSKVTIRLHMPGTEEEMQ